MLNELYAIFKRNFPFIVRDDKTVFKILGHKDNKIIDKRNGQNELIGVSVINRNTILLLCVDMEYRNKGIGTELLSMSEEYMKQHGYHEIVVGEGFDYLMPGVPTSKRYFPSVNENLNCNIDDKASNFFAKRGYTHSRNCNCFDMRFDLSDFKNAQYNIGDTINHITYRWAAINDLDEIIRCTGDACKDFTKYYTDKKLYDQNGVEKVLIATVNNEVVGTLIIGNETDGGNLGSIGCTTVKRAYRGNHIAVNLVTLGTGYLKELGLKEAYLSYTYSGLDHLYGYAGYKICMYFMMAKKELWREYDNINF